MATIVHNMKAYRVGCELVEKLKKVIDRYSFGLKRSTSLKLLLQLN